MKKLFFRLFSISRPFLHTQKHILGILKNMKTLSLFLAALLSFVLLLLQPALAGAPPIQWQKTFGGSDQDRGYSVQQTIDGGFIIAGYTHSYGEGEYDVYLIKTDQNGNSQWQKTFGGSDRDYGHSVQQTSDGGYIIAGSTESYGAGFNDVYLIKTDADGNSQWQKTFGEAGSEWGRSVRQTSDGGYVIAGQTYPYTTYDNDIYLIKTDSNGNSQWQKTFGGSDSDYVFSVQQTTDGGYIMAGYTCSYGAGKADVYLIKTDPNGNSRWQKTFGGNDSDISFSVQQTADGGYIIAGHTFGPLLASSDVYLIKTDPNGDMQWQKTFGGTNYDAAYSVQKTMDDGYIIAGRTESFSCLMYNSDVYLIKTDPNGISQWQKTVGGSNWDTGFSVQQIFDGGYIIAGYTYYDVGGEPYEYDVYLIKLCSDGTLSADLNCNGTVYYDDLEILLDQWLQTPGILSADIAPEPGDGIVNFLDFRILAQDWLQTSIP